MVYIGEVLILLVTTLLSCKNVDSGPTKAVPIDALTFATPSGDTVMRVPIEGLQLGLVTDSDGDTLSYNPGYTVEVGTDWVSPTEATRHGDVVYLRYPDDVLATLTITAVGNDRWDLTWKPQSDDVGFYRVEATGDPTEGFYGLGEYFDSPHHRGKVRNLQLEPSGHTESGYNEAHVPVPLVIGTTGWGLFIADDHSMRFEVATEADDLVRATVGAGPTSDGLQWHVYTADHPMDITKLYYDTTGYPGLPAPWALGPIFWRDETTGQDEVQSDIDTMRELDIPASALWIDRPYASAVNSFDFHPDDYADPQAMIDYAHDMGFRMGLWHTPYADDEATTINAEALAGGFYPPLTPEVILLVVNWGPLIDFTNPDALAWWTGHVKDDYIDMGIEGFKLDFAEDVVPGLFQYRVAWEFFDGSDERTMQHQYQRLYHQAYRAALGEGAGYLLCRTGAWGDQTVGSIIWPGDIDGSLGVHGQDMGEYVSVGGLPAAVVASLSLGPSGYPFFGSDTGGYRNTPPNKETFTRWFEHTSLSSVMQIGMSSSDVAWDFVLDWDEEMLDWYRDYSRLHLRLFPYSWTYAQRIADDGHPIQRPLGLAHPELGEDFLYDYLYGEHLLVAPVVKAGDTTRRVVFPEGRWFDWFDGDVLDAGEHVVDAPLGKLPLFLKEGGMVPMLRPTIDTLAPVADPSAIESFDADPGRLYVRVFPGGSASSFAMYDGTVLTQELVDGVATLGYTGGDVFVQGVEFEVVGLGATVVVSLDGDGEVTAP